MFGLVTPQLDDPREHTFSPNGQELICWPCCTPEVADLKTSPGDSLWSSREVAHREGLAENRSLERLRVLLCPECRGKFQGCVL